MGQYNFRKDLATAKVTEEEVAKLLKKKYKAKILETDDTFKYDLLVEIQGHILKVEIKEDFRCGDTGNAVLEFACRGKPSGIKKTQADIYVHKMHLKDGIKFILHKTSDLKKLVRYKKYFRIVNGGDKGSNSMNYLFKYDVFEKPSIALGEPLPLTK